MKTKYLKKKIDATIVEEMRQALALLPAKLSPDPVCDFCGNDTPVVVYGSFKMSTGVFRQCWRWCACEDCDRDIDQNDWSSILVKIVGRLEIMTQHKFPLGIVAKAAEAAFQEFLDYAITGKEV